jgi:hypothetical protein
MALLMIAAVFAVATGASMRRCTTRRPEGLPTPR